MKGVLRCYVRGENVYLAISTPPVAPSIRLMSKRNIVSNSFYKIDEGIRFLPP